MIYPSSSYQSLMKLGLEEWCPAFRGGHLQPEPVPAHRHAAFSRPFLACLVLFFVFFCPSLLLLFLLATIALQWCACVCACARAHTGFWGVFFFLFFLLDVCYFWKAR